MKKEIQEEVKRISPGFPTRNSGRRPMLPDRYFSKMQDEVMNRILSEKRDRRKIVFLTLWQKVAAVVLVGSGLFLMARMEFWRDPGQVSEAGIELTRKEALDYALGYPDEFGPLLDEINGEAFADHLFPADAIPEWDDDALEQVLDELSDESIDELL